MDTVKESQGSDGSFRNAKTSVTLSSGTSLAVEATSLAIMAFVKTGDFRYSDQIKKSVEFLVNSMNQGSWVSTQATILAMRALVEFQNTQGQGDKTFKFDVKVNSTVKELVVIPPDQNPNRRSLFLDIYIMC